MPAGTRCSFDAVIVGAGPAGATAATLLARAGWAVALVEQQRFPRRKVCGECLAASNLPLLDALGIADSFVARAGPELRSVQLLRGDDMVRAELPAAADARHRWGRALGRETLDTLLLARARAAGTTLFQPWTLAAAEGRAGDWSCRLRAVDTSQALTLRSPVLIDAHGSWSDLPATRARRRQTRDAGNLFAFKANFSGASPAAGAISVLALDGGYGGMVQADGGTTTLACCVRRDRLDQLRGAAPGQRAGDAIEAWLRRTCGGVDQALRGAVRDGPWLAAGPIDPGVRLGCSDGLLRIGNAAGEAHPILGEGMSMALQSAALLCRHLTSAGSLALQPDAALQAGLQHGYALDWRRQFAPRLHVAAAFAHAAMRPAASAALLGLARRWPALLTHGARWGGKVRPLALATTAAMPLAHPENP